MAFSDKYQKPNLLKPLFLVFNIVAYIAYFITILAFSLSKKDDPQKSDVIDSSSWLSTFYRVVSGINGLCFFILTVSLLNYGSRLEKIVHAIKVKGLSQQQRQQHELQNYIGASGSSHAINVPLNQVDLARELP